MIWAVHSSGNGFDVNTIGWILFVVGIAGALLSLMFWSSWGGVGGRRDVVEHRRV